MTEEALDDRCERFLETTFDCRYEKFCPQMLCDCRHEKVCPQMLCKAAGCVRLWVYGRWPRTESRFLRLT